MALITKIRNNSWLLIVVLGLGLLAFLMMDMFGGNRGSASDMTLGTVNGESIDYRTFQNMENTLYRGSGQSTYANKSNLWDFFIDKAISGQMAEKMGLGVSADEMTELHFGANLSPIVAQRFTNPTTGQVDREALNGWRTQDQNNTLQPDQRTFWKTQMEEVKVDRLQSKINHIVGKSMYVPNWMAELRQNEQTQSASVSYVRIPFDQIPNSEVEVSDEDLMAYMKKYAAQYAQDEPTRTAKYAVLDVLPTRKDTADIITRLNNIKEQWVKKGAEDSTYVMSKKGSYPIAYQMADALSDTMKNVAFNLEVGSFYGPFMDQGSYRVIKILDKKIIPDSVASRHILRNVNWNDREAALAADALIDSLRDAISSGATTFEDAARSFGQDGTNAQGGDLGYSAQGRMVPEFNNAIFFQSEGDELIKVNTQFGIHLVQVTDRIFETKEEGVRMASVSEVIKPSVATQEARFDDIYSLLSANVGVEALTKAVNARGLEMKTSPPLKQNDFTFPEIGTDPSARELIRWLFTPGVDKGETSPDVYVYKDPQLFYDAKLVVAGLEEVSNGDYPAVNAVRAQLEPLVRNEKKGELLKSRINGTDLATIASNFGTTVQEEESVSLRSRGMSGLGSEAKVLGVALSQNDGSTSAPIVGRDGVYVIRTNSKTEPTPVSDLASAKRLQSSMAQQQVRFQLWRALRKGADIDDQRFARF